jgi:hypothetical protein
MNITFMTIQFMELIIDNSVGSSKSMFLISITWTRLAIYNSTIFLHKQKMYSVIKVFKIINKECGGISFECIPK